MAITNFLDYVTYPNEDQREQILTDYFDTQKLQLDLTQYLTLNNLTEKITTNAFDSRGLFYTVNKDLRENVRRYNNDVFYLTDAMEACRIPAFSDGICSSAGIRWNGRIPPHH